MLIPLREIYDKYNLNIKGIIHIGAYNAEEKPAYDECGVKKVIWIEALSNLAKRLTQKFKNDKTQTVLHAVISDKNQITDFVITNNEASSSLLDLGTHLQHHPKVKEERRIKVYPVTMDWLIHYKYININNYNFLNIDIQGAELKALKGMKNNLKHIDYLYLEVNTEHLYKDCCLLSELDEYLTDFKRVELQMTKYFWGDGFWLRKTLL